MHRLKKRLAVDLPIELHNYLQYICRKRRCTLSKWVIEKLTVMAQIERALEIQRRMYEEQQEL